MSFGINTYPTVCDRCGRWLPTQTGHLIGIDQQTRRWRVRCGPCAGIATPAEREIARHEAVLDYLVLQEGGQS